MEMTEGESPDCARLDIHVECVSAADLVDMFLLFRLHPSFLLTGRAEVSFRSGFARPELILLLLVGSHYGATRTSQQTAESRNQAMDYQRAVSAMMITGWYVHGHSSFRCEVQQLMIPVSRFQEHNWIRLTAPQPVRAPR